MTDYTERLKRIFGFTKVRIVEVNRVSDKDKYRAMFMDIVDAGIAHKRKHNTPLTESQSYRAQEVSNH